jgi:hypothetical protein
LHKLLGQKQEVEEVLFEAKIIEKNTALRGDFDI